MQINLTKLAASIENTKAAGQFWARPVDQSHLDRLLERETLLDRIARAATFSELRALMNQCETAAQFAAIALRETQLENEHGPQVDPMAHVEFPFAENH